MPRRFVMLTADGGEMTVTRPIATVVWGSWQVTIPEGREQEHQDDRVSEGYVCLPDHRTGRFDLACVRADASVDASAGILKGHSTVEQAIDGAQKKTSGDVLFERDITGLGLGRFVPGKHFATGDVVDVWVWGKLMELPVTAVDMVSTPADPLGWRVHVGGQLIANTEELRESSAKIASDIEVERRKRMKDTERLSDAASKASSAASTAKEAADQAQATADTAKETADEAQDKAIESLNKFRELQEEWNKKKDEIDKAQSVATAALERGAARMLFSDREKTTMNAHLEIINPRFSREVTVIASGSWEGVMAVQINTTGGQMLQRHMEVNKDQRIFRERMPLTAPVANTMVIYQLRDSITHRTEDTHDTAPPAGN